MFSNLFGGMFGSKAPVNMNQAPDALAQASMGAPAALGGGKKAGGKFDPSLIASMMRGFQMGSGGFGSAQMPQFGQFYRPMGGQQQGSFMFDPMGMRR